jgi:uncharacterized protein (TIGR02118 family)
VRFGEWQRWFAGVAATAIDSCRTQLGRCPGDLGRRVFQPRSCIMVRLLVLYGHPKDPAAFDRYYDQIHIPLARRMRGFRKWTIGKVLGTPDGKPPDYYYIADLYADSRAQIEAILETPEGKAAVEDVPKYASGGVTFLYTDVEDVI